MNKVILKYMRLAGIKESEISFIRFGLMLLALSIVRLFIMIVSGDWEQVESNIVVIFLIPVSFYLIALLRQKFTPDE